jgi:hypothetical protein
MLLDQLAIGRFMVMVLQSHNCSVRSQSISSHRVLGILLLYFLGYSAGFEIGTGIGGHGLTISRRFIHEALSKSGASPSR